MSKMDTNLIPDVYFSYSQILVYDADGTSPACEWTDAHSRQGFARRDQAVAVGTLLEFGHAKVRVSDAVPRSFNTYQRVIAVPLLIKSGQLAIEGVEEYPIDRTLSVSPGLYRTIIAQNIIDDEHEAVDVFIEPYNSDIVQSQILIADESLDPPSTLIEDADVPHL